MKMFESLYKDISQKNNCSDYAHYLNNESQRKSKQTRESN